MFWIFASEHKKYAKLTLLGIMTLIFFVIGKAVNSRWCMTRYNFTSYSDFHLKDFSFDKFEMVINGWLSNLGYKSDVKLFSTEGILGNALFVVLVFVVGAALFFAWKHRKQYDEKHKLVIVYFLCMAVIFLLLYLFTDSYFESRYLLPITIWIIPVTAILFQNEDQKICTVTAGVLVLLCLLVSFAYYGRDITNPNEEYEKIAQILEEQDMHEGYSTFWHANLLTEISNGNAEVWHCEIEKDQFMIQNVRPWLQKKEHGLRTPEGKCFIWIYRL